MRIVAGTSKGRQLTYPKGGHVRPTSEKVREAIFSILGRQAVQESTVLDLFSGSGALGLEALSRGAAKVVFVEGDPVVIRTLAQNIKALGYTGSTRIIRRKVEAALPDIILAGEKYQLVFMDPPYRAELVRKALETKGFARIMEPDATVVAEHGAGELEVERLGDFVLVDRRRYGDTEVTFWEVTETAEDHDSSHQ